jgi:hypothetical protein
MWANDGEPQVYKPQINEMHRSMRHNVFNFGGIEAKPQL